jgi:2-polyprenyl-6-methoxyphenol hydroxylase-like FAD-dependent oxidoreductase
VSAEGDRFDVVIVGTGIAGSTAAMLYGRSGRRVALVEKHSDPRAYKTVCGHFIQSHAHLVIERLGLVRDFEALGAVRTGVDTWSRYGWAYHDARDDRPPSWNVRRAKLDPMLREAAATTPGVELMLGCTATDLIRDGGRVSGVEVRDRSGEVRRLLAKVVVAADGRQSTLGKLAGVEETVKPNNRFAYAAYYRVNPTVRDKQAQVWFLDPDPDYAIASPTDDGLVQFAGFISKDRLGDWKGDVEAALVRHAARLPDAPAIRPEARESKFIAKLEMPNTIRRAAIPGLAFVGDAAMAADPVWGVGCGWAFESAEWLVEATADAVAADQGVDRALADYAKTHRRRLYGHFLLTSSYSTGRRFNPIERLKLRAAANDSTAARHMQDYTERLITPGRYLTPRAIARAAAVALRSPRSRGGGAPSNEPQPTSAAN